MRFVALFYLTLSSVIAADGETIRAFGHKWTVPIASDWKIEDGPVPRTPPRRTQTSNTASPAEAVRARRDSYRGKTLP